MMKSFIGVAASVLISLGVCMALFGGGSQTLYAQVARAMSRIDRVHLTMDERRDEKPYRQSESWYERGVGYRLHETIGGKLRVTLDDGVSVWSYAEGEDLVAKSKSYRDVKDPASFGLDKMMLPRVMRFDPQRVPGGDREVDGGAWRCYTLEREGEKSTAWVDESDLVREFESRRRREDQSIDEASGRAEFEVAMGAGRFVPDFPQDARVVDPRTFLGERYTIDGAIFRREAAGQVFAVHELGRFDDEWAYVVTSNRLTEANRLALGIDHPWHYFGQADLNTDWGRVNHEPISSPHKIAVVKIGDLTVQWHLLGVRYQKRLDRFAVEVTVNAANELEDLMGDRETFERFAVELPIADAIAEPHVTPWLEAVHADVQRLAPLLHAAGVMEVVPNPPKTNGLLVTRDPQAYNAVLFVENVRQRMREIPRR